MAIQYKDYYKTLGLKRDASDKEIKQTYRKLARKYHPDVNPENKKSEDRFKDINEAYEVLGDSEKKGKYDRLGANWNAGSDFTPPPGWDGVHARTGGFRDFAGGGGFGDFSDFFSSLFGQGQGRDFSGRTPRSCRKARGGDIETKLAITLEEAYNGCSRSITLKKNETCSSCGGKGIVDNRSCGACNGMGMVMRPRHLDINIPPNVRGGSKIRLSGQGEEGIGGGPAGDLYLHIKLEPHPHFTLLDSDVQIELPLTPWEAILGTEVEVLTLKGYVKMKIPSATKSDQRLRLKGMGLSKKGGERGDQYVKTKIVVPKITGEREKELYMELAQLHEGEMNGATIGGSRR